MPDTSNRSRDSQGHFIRSTPEIEHDRLAAELRGEGLSYAAIAQRLGISRSHAWEAVQRAFRDTLAPAAQEARAVELARLENAHDAALEVLLREHITVSHGRIVKDDDGNPIIDDAPILQAIDRIRALSESRRKLLGLDAPSRVSVDAENLGQEIAGILDALTQTATDDQPST